MFFERILHSSDLVHQRIPFSLLLRLLLAQLCLVLLPPAVDVFSVHRHPPLRAVIVHQPVGARLWRCRLVRCGAAPPRARVRAIVCACTRRVHVCVRPCMRACVCMQACVCVCATVRACVHVFRSLRAHEGVAIERAGFGLAHEVIDKCGAVRIECVDLALVRACVRAHRCVVVAPLAFGI